jgi:hypothetical protein
VKPLLTILLCALLLPTKHAVAQSAPVSEKSPQTLRPAEQSLADYEGRQKPIFRTLPALQLTPINKTSILSFSYSHIDIQAKGKRTPDTLGIDGYSVSPAIIFSGKEFGLGISGELGDGQTLYRDESYAERGVLKHSGAGITALYNPTPSWQRVFVTFTATTKLLTVRQQARTEYGDRKDPWERTSYQAYRHQLGSNLTLRLSKNFAIIPWGQVGYLDNSQLDTLNSASTANRLRFDSAYFLGEGYRSDYGVDVALRINRFEIHLGNVLGAALNNKKNKHSDQVRDNSISVSLTLQTEAKRTER